MVGWDRSSWWRVIPCGSPCSAEFALHSTTVSRSHHQTTGQRTKVCTDIDTVVGTKSNVKFGLGLLGHRASELGAHASRESVDTVHRLVQSVRRMVAKHCAMNEPLRRLKNPELSHEEKTAEWHQVKVLGKEVCFHKFLFAL